MGAEVWQAESGPYRESVEVRQTEGDERMQMIGRRIAVGVNVQLSGVTLLELIINPNISGGLARASLKNLRMA